MTQPLDYTATLQQLTEEVRSTLELLPPPAYSFPWDNCTAALKEALRCDHLTIEGSDWNVTAPEKLSEGFDANSLLLAVALPPVEGHILIAFSESDLDKLIHGTTLPSPTPYPLPKGLKKGFVSFLYAHLLRTIDQQNAFFGASPRLVSTEETFPTDSVLSMDLTITLDDHHLFARLMLPEPFASSWQQHCNQHHSKLQGPIVQQAPVDLSITVGATSLSQEEWDRINVGDLLLLDSCTLDTQTKTGSAHAMAQGYQVFDATVDASGTLKVGHTSLQDTQG